MEAKRQEMSALNLNPLAPAQSKHTFPFSGKTGNCNEHTSILTPFSVLFIHFSSLFLKSRKRGPGSRPRVLKTHQNGCRGCQTESKDLKMEPQGPPSNKKNNKCIPRVLKRSPMCYKVAPRCPRLSQALGHYETRSMKNHRNPEN